MSSTAIEIQVLGMGKRFGPVAALDNVSIRVPAGSFHALLGENGAGKSTLVKCMVGYYAPDTGAVIVNEHERVIRNPHDAHALGIGMVYQHFTLVPSMSVAENLVMARGNLPPVVDWRAEGAALRQFMATVPFKIDLDKPVASLAAGEKQKVEILKQLYLKRGFMILDEPTSVLTPAESDEVLGMLRTMTRAGSVTVLMITHKFREVMIFADQVSVLRRGRLAGEGKVTELNPQRLAEMMVGTKEIPASVAARNPGIGRVRLDIEGLCVEDDIGMPAVSDVNLAVKAGEIVGIAGVAGNGQRELVEALIGQRTATAGHLSVHGVPYRATRSETVRHRVYSLPEEPLKNACVADMSVAENMALRNFDQAPIARGRWWLRKRVLRAQAAALIAEYKVRTPSPEAPISALSGGNVQRAVLARELSGDVDVLIAANPVFGLDFAAVAEIHNRIVTARNRGAAVLLVSEDLDELLELADRILVMCDGRLVYETSISEADTATIGRYMAGHQSKHAA